MRERTWRAEEIAILERDYSAQGAAYVAALLGRSTDSVSSLARRLGMPSPRRQCRRSSAIQARRHVYLRLPPAGREPGST